MSDDESKGAGAAAGTDSQAYTAFVAALKKNGKDVGGFREFPNPSIIQLMNKYQIDIEQQDIVLKDFRKHFPLPTNTEANIVDNGLPQLPAKTGPSTTDASTNRKHLAVQLSKRDMKVLKNGQGDFSYQAAPKSSTIHRTLTGVSGNNWNSETDIHMFVKEVLAEVLACLGLHDVHLLCEVSLDGERTDIMLLSRSGVRLGVVEVKKPAGKNPLGCDDKPSRIHGQVRDYLLLLNTYHSCQHAFGIATSYEQWRFYWLEEESNDYLDEQSASASSSSASSSSEPAVKKKKTWPYR